ncbi:MAG: tetratricopeptide repeat protein [Bacillota bacterium]|nr:tetratricopeptide repeat protein [Bacillota bacterium]
MDYFEKAEFYYNKKDYGMALNAYMKALTTKQNEPALIYNCAMCLIKLQRYEDAIAFLKAAIELKQDSRFYFNLAYCYAKIGDNKKALLYFNTAWALDNEDKDCERAIDMILRSLTKKSR